MLACRLAPFPALGGQQGSSAGAPCMRCCSSHPWAESEMQVASEMSRPPWVARWE